MNKPARRFWQLHLSTLIVLSFVAGLLLWANMPYDYTRDVFSCRGQGWPKLFSNEVTGGFISLGKYGSGEWLRLFSYRNIAIDIATAIAILAAVAVVCEMVARRKAKA